MLSGKKVCFIFEVFPQVLFLGPLYLHYMDGVFRLYLGKCSKTSFIQYTDNFGIVMGGIAIYWKRFHL